MSILYCDKCDCALHACTCGDTHFADDATLKHIQELTAQLEASRKEVVRLREALKIASHIFSFTSIGKCEEREILLSALASTTPDPVWKHNFMVRKMRELPILGYVSGETVLNMSGMNDHSLGMLMEQGKLLVAIPELKNEK